MRRLEDGTMFLPKGSEFVDIEKATVVDLI
jgi:hypothetical protein